MRGGKNVWIAQLKRFLVLSDANLWPDGYMIRRLVNFNFGGKMGSFLDIVTENAWIA